MPSSPRAIGHVLVALALTACVVVVPLRGADEPAAALPIAASAVHEAPCESSASQTMDHAAHGGMLMPTAAACTPFRPAISMTGWSIKASSSAKGHSASAALRGGSRTWWQSRTSGKFRAQTLTLRAPAVKTVTGLQYTPAAGRGAIGRFEVRLSADGHHFGSVVAQGRWERSSVTKQVGWSPSKVRAVKLTVRTVSPARTRSVTVATIALTGVSQPPAVVQQPAPEATQTPAPGPEVSSTPVPIADPVTTAVPGATAVPDSGVTPTPTATAMPMPTGTSTPSPMPTQSPTPTPTPTPTPSPTPSPTAAPSSAAVGRWGPTIAFPLVPVAVAAIPGNRLVVWAADEDMSFGTTDAAATQTAVLDLSTGSVSATRVSNTGHNMFCPGISLLADGRVLVTGGISNVETSIYNPKTDRWSGGPKMNLGRGYQGQTTLSGGGAFTIGGSWSGGIGGKVGEVYSPNGTWRLLPGATTDAMLTADNGGIYRSDNHAWLVASSDGTVLQAGPSKQMNWISTAGDGTMTPAGTRGDAGDQMNGNAVLFDVDKVLTLGGASSYENVDATGAADVLDLSGGYGKPVSVSKTGSLAHPRSFANSVVLPDGGVLAIGGMGHPVPFSDTGSVLTPELWNPATGTWSEMADAAEPRNYHSVATLLPDGTVFSGGGGLCGAGCATNHPTGQIFSPPYLFASDGSPAARPTVIGVPAAADPGQDITVTAGAGASRFVLIRASASTHSVDNDQRRVPLVIRSRNGSAVTVSIPDDNGVVLPGRYMLFAMTAAGVPSISAPVTIGVKG